MKPLITVSVGQKTVKPPSMFSWNVVSAPEAINKSAKALQPCLDNIAVKFNWPGPGVGASASVEVNTYNFHLHILISIII